MKPCIKQIDESIYKEIIRYKFKRQPNFGEQIVENFS